MPQFSVYRNPNRDTATDYPLLLEVQSDLIAGLATVVVVPLCSALSMREKCFKVLTPVFDVAGEPYIMLTPQLAGIPKNLVGPKVADLTHCRDEIIAALDLLITGI